MRIPEEGDLVWVDFDPVRGTEQAGIRPAIVLSSSNLHRESSKAIVCPITRNQSAWPTKVNLPAGMKTQGSVLADQIRAVHRSERGFRFIERAPQEVLAQVREIVGAIIGITA